MADVETVGNLNDTSHKLNGDANGTLPDITFPEKEDRIQPRTDGDYLDCFAGPVIDGHETIVTLYTPPQLAKSKVLPSLYYIINEAFDAGHSKDGVTWLHQKRLRYENAFLDQLGNGAGTFTYNVSWRGTNRVIATATVKRYVGDMVNVEKDGLGEGSAFKRHGPVPPNSEAWELSTMAVDPELQGRGLAGLLMKWTEDEVKRTFKTSLRETHDAGNAGPTQLIMMLTTVREINERFYTKRGFMKDYETWHEKGYLVSVAAVWI